MTDIELMEYLPEEHELAIKSNRLALEAIVWDMVDVAGVDDVVTDLKLLLEKLEARLN
ncbi:hypothetical protein MXMO3_01699 [Maritalea myrionectae]|uniref:Uncharacterized protein n=1 Tax=Maritalea myrionectae TaxID=454601 RepID=A0A2R4ME51_9HYPH|nr:hypothetical protein [Maritalea myrionectae]AVX04225.1 hypothetical protein MXMO3_01699 [Maritalea myrionectae]